MELNSEDFSSIKQSTSIKIDSPKRGESLKKKLKHPLPIESIREDNQDNANPDADSLSEGSPIGDASKFAPEALVLANCDFNYATNYSYYPTYFDSLPTRLLEDDEDESQLWEKGKEMTKSARINANLDHGINPKGESPEEVKRRMKEKDREPNFFVNGEGLRLARNSLFCLSESSRIRRFLLQKILGTKVFNGLVLFFLILNLIAYGLYDFEYRLSEDGMSLDVVENLAAFYLELFCNLFFSLDFVLRIIAVGFILEPYTFLRTGEGIANFLLLILNWLFLIQQHEHPTTSVLSTLLFLKGLRIFRVIRILFIFKDLKQTAGSLISAIPSMARTFYCLLIVFCFYAIWGLHFFRGVEEYRCRQTPEPELLNETLVWPIVEGLDMHCGYWSCPNGTYCGSPADYGMPFDHEELNSEIFNYGVTTFSTFYDSLLVVLHFLFLVGWSNFTYMNWREVDGFFTALFFGSLVIIGFFIMVNLFLASVYDSFMYHTSIRDKKKKLQNQTTETEKKTEKGENFFLTLGNIKDSPRKKPEPAHHRKENDMKVSRIPLMPKFTLAEGARREGFLSGVREWILWIFEQNWCRRLISLLIIGDIIVLCLDGYPIARSEMILLHQFDFFFFCCFFSEITLKIFAAGIHQIRKSFIFVLDVFIVYANFAVLIYEVASGLDIFEEGSKVGIGVKTLKMIRIFRVLYYTQLFSSLSIIIRALIKTLSKMKQFFFIMAVLVIVLALMGMQIFSKRARFHETISGGLIFELETGVPARPNFENFFDACVSIMLILYNEEWHIAMYQHSIAVGQISQVFYILSVFIAQIIMMKLLVALFLNNFINYIKTEIIEEQQGDILQILKSGFKRKLLSLANYINNTNEKSKLAGLKMKLFKNIMRFTKTMNISEGEIEEGEKKHDGENIFMALRLQVLKKPNSTTEPSSQIPSSDITERRLLKKNLISTQPNNAEKSPVAVSSPKNETKASWFRICLANLCRRSLLIFPRTSFLRRKLRRILCHWSFEAFMLVVIFISSLILVIENPFEDPNNFQQVFLNSLDMAVTIIYGIEFLMNAIAFGFILGSDSYLRRSAWNLLDFAILILSLLGVIITKDQMRVNSMKVFRTIRILKMGQRNLGIRVATKALISAFPNIIRLMVFSFIFILGFALYGMRYLKSLFYHCTTVNAEFLENYVKTQSDCMDYGGDWIRYDMHFDNIFTAFSTLFQVATSEGWLLEMYKAVDATEFGKQPHRDHNKYWIIFYLFYFFVGNFLVMNMFIAVIGETYLDQKNRASKFNLLTEEQKEWALIKTSIYKLKPKKKKTKILLGFQEHFIRFRKLKPVKYFYYLSIAFNCVILALYHHRQTPSTTELLDKMNMAMIYIFTFFFALRSLCAVSLRNFLLSRNTIISIISLSLTYASFGISNPDRVLNSLAKASQTLFAYHILKNFKIVQRTFHTLFFVLPSLSNIVSLMLLILYIYTIIAMDIFSYLRPQKTVNGYDVDFKTFPRALFSLFRVTTAELWFLIVNDCTRERAPNFACMNISSYDDYVRYGLNGCGSTFYYFFFYTYHLFFSLIIMNLFIVTILVSYGEVYNAEQRAIDRFQLSKINDLWTHFDPLAQGYINYKDFWTLASKIAVEFGVSEVDLLEVKNKKNFIDILKIPLYENTKEKVFCYKFHDVIVRLAEISVTVKYGVVE